MDTLKPAEPRLVDAAIPGMGDVMAPLRFVTAMGWDATAARIRYLRYKPATSLVAGLELVDSRGHTSFAQAVALAAGGHHKLAKIARRGASDDVGRGSVVDAGRLVALADVTADRHLPGIRHFLRSRPPVAPLLYKPGRRWAGRYHGRSQPEMVKIHRPAAAVGHARGFSALAHLPVAEVTKVSPRRGLVRTRWVPGVPLDTVPADLGLRLVPETGRLLADIHASPPVRGMRPVDVAGRTAAAVAAIRAVVPADAGIARTTADTILGGLGNPRDLRVVHGDFSADQVIIRPDLAGSDAAAGRGQAPVTVIDLDRVALDDPLADLGCWYSFQVSDPSASTDVDVVLAPLLEGYEQRAGRPDRARLRMHCAHQVLLRASEPFRQHQPDWPAEVHRLVSLAEGLLQ